MSDVTPLNPENIPTREEIKSLVGGLKDFINSNPKIRGQKNVKTDGAQKGFYYNEKEAKGLIPYLDEIEKDKENRELRYQDYPQWNPNTLWAKINQAVQYIVDNLDTEDFKYRTIRSHLKIAKGESSITFTWIEHKVQEGQWLLHKVVDSKKVIDNYKTRVFKFMEESSEGEELDIKEGLDLNQEEIDVMKSLFSESPIFLAFVSANRIKIVHAKQGIDNE